MNKKALQFLDYPDLGSDITESPAKKWERLQEMMRPWYVRLFRRVARLFGGEK